MVITLLFLKKKNLHSFLPMESSPSSDPQDNIPVIEDISKDGEDGYISQGEALSCHVTISHLWNTAKWSKPTNQPQSGRDCNHWGTLVHGANDHLPPKLEKSWKTGAAPLITDFAGHTFFMYPSHSLSSAVRASWCLLIAESCLSPSGTK